MSAPPDIFGCVLSTGRTDKDGYAFHGKTRAHIHAWTEANGPVPEGMVLDHLCANRRCKSVHHLQAVTQSENLFRRSFKYRSRIKTCPKGHDMSLNAVVTPYGGGGRVCRQCNREAANGQ